MELLIDTLLSGVIQVLLFSSIPILWWLVTARKKESFFYWIGLRRVERNQGFVKAFTLVILSFSALSVIVLLMMRGVEMAVSDFLGLGIGALPAALVYAFLNTAFSEEILFRGFILKRLSSRLGFSAANMIQAALFGILHGMMFFALIGALKAMVIIAFTGLIGWCMGYVNEKKAGGSIWPSWLIHGISNLLSSLVALFSIL